MDTSSYTSLFSEPTMGFNQSTKNCSIARLLQVGCRMFYSSKIHNTGYVLLRRRLLKSLQTKNIESLAKLSNILVQAKQLAISIKEVWN